MIFDTVAIASGSWCEPNPDGLKTGGHISECCGVSFSSNSSITAHDSTLRNLCCCFFCSGASRRTSPKPTKLHALIPVLKEMVFGRTRYLGIWNLGCTGFTTHGASECPAKSRSLSSFAILKASELRVSGLGRVGCGFRYLSIIQRTGQGTRAAKRRPTACPGRRLAWQCLGSR